MWMREFVTLVVAGNVSLSYWWSEVLELWEEIRKGSPKGMREEWSDVTCLAQIALIQHTPWINWPLVPGFGKYAALKFLSRMKVWEEIFRKEGLSFDKKYLINGGNYERPHKVQLALDLARSEQGAGSQQV